MGRQFRMTYTGGTQKPTPKVQVNVPKKKKSKPGYSQQASGPARPEVK